MSTTGYDFHTALAPYGPTHRMHRKLLSYALHPRAVLENFVPVQERFSRQLAKALIEDPDDFIQHMRRYVMGRTARLTVHSFR